MTRNVSSQSNGSKKAAGGRRARYPILILFVVVGLLLGAMLIARWGDWIDRALVRVEPVRDVLPSSPPLTLTLDHAVVTVREGQVALNGGQRTGSHEGTLELGASLGQVRDEGDGRWSWSYLATDGPDASPTVTITAQTGTGPAASATFQLVVENVAPQVSLSVERLVEPGDAALGRGSFADPGADAWQASVDYGDGTGARPLPLADDGTFELSHPYPDPGEYTLTVCVQDDDGQQGCASATVAVAPTLPGVRLTNRSGRIREGETAMLAFSRPGRAALGRGMAGWLYSYDCTGDGQYEVEDQPDQRLYRCWYPNDGTYAAYGRVKGEAGAQTELQVEVQVEPVAPTARLEAGPAAVRAGETVQLAFSQATDPSPEDVQAGFRYAYDCTGDGTFDLEDTGEATYDCTYSQSGTFAARGRISDQGGAWNEYQVEVHVTDARATTRLASLTQPVYEGVPAQLALVEPGDPPAGRTYAFDCAGDGVYEQSETRTNSFSCLYPDQGTYTARGRTSDADGRVTEYEIEMVVQNAAPTATLAQIPDTVLEGGSIVLKLQNPVDTSAEDVYSGYRYAFDCTGDGVFEVADTPQDSHLCGYNDDGLYVARARIYDRDGDWSEYTAQVRVLNALPQANLPATATVDEGQTYVLVLSDPRDPSPADTEAGFRYAYDCDGDGTFEVVDQGSGAHTCPYPDDGSFLSRAQIRDVDGAESEYTIRVTAHNVSPTVGTISLPPKPFLAGTEIEAAAEFTDPGVLDVHSARWEWGDERVSSGRVDEVSGSGSVSGTHAYLGPGLYWIQVQVSDGDGGSGTSPLAEVPVYDPAAAAVDGEVRFDSPPGAYARNPAFSRQAWLALSAEYAPGVQSGTPPQGWIAFELVGGGMRFEGQTLDWLVVAGKRSWLAGTGTVNGVGRFGISVALDLGPDPGRVRVRIWDQEGDDAVLYDSQSGAAHQAAPTTLLTEAQVVLPNP